LSGLCSKRGVANGGPVAELIDFASRKKQIAPSEEKWALLTIDEAFRGVVIAWIHLHDTHLADSLFKYVVEGYNNGTYVIEVPERLWMPVQEDMHRTLMRIRQEAKDKLKISDT
jgi:hypothetical protein